MTIAIPLDLPVGGANETGPPMTAGIFERWREFEESLRKETKEAVIYDEGGGDYGFGL